MSLNLCHLNIRSLPAHYQLLKESALLDFDIIALTETWLTGELPDNLYSVHGYKLIRCDRQTRGGGVALYIRESIKSSVLKMSSSNNIEQLWIRTTMGEISTAIGVLYRPPRGSYDAFMDEFTGTLEDVTLDYGRLICMGDFNVDLMAVTDIRATQMLETFDTLQLKQLIETPTRVFGASATLIDYVVVSESLVVQGQGTLDCGDMSDHCAVFCEVPFSVPRREFRKIKARNYKDFDYELFRQDCHRVEWYMVFDMPSVEEKLSFLTTAMLQILDCHAPMKEFVHRRPAAPWLTYNIKCMMGVRDSALRRYKRSRNPVHHEYYKTLRNEVNRAILREKKAYYSYKCAGLKNNPKQLWGELRKLNVASEAVTIPESLCDPDKINRHFVGSGTGQDDLGVIGEYDTFMAGDVLTFSFEHVSVNEVTRATESLRSNSGGYDGMTLRDIKLFLPVVGDYVAHVFNACIDQGQFPRQWKTSLVRPLAKKKSVVSLGDLRPVRLLPVMSKIFERLLERQLRSYVVDRGLLPSRQSGFRPNYGCATALSHILDDIVAATDKGQVTALVLLDFSRAFDMVCHKILLAILASMGLRGVTLSLVASYLDDRRQCVVVDGMESGFLPLKSGVPQGAIMSPLLYSLYTHALPKYVKRCDYHLYADDTQIYKSFHPADVERALECLSETLVSLSQFSDKHHLRLNAAKTQLILFGPVNARNEVRDRMGLMLGAEQIIPSKCVKNLGLLIDEDMKFHANTSYLIRKAYLSLKGIYQHRQVLTFETKKLLCETLVLSTLNYLDCIYEGFLRYRDRARLQRIQNACLRMMYGIRRTQSIRQKVRECGWLTMEERRRLHSAVFFYRVFVLREPAYLWSKISLRCDVHSVNIRARHFITIPSHKHELYKRCFSYRFAHYINFVFSRLGHCVSLRSFKSKFKILLTTEHPEI